MFGLRPVDYALTPEMQDVLRTSPEASDPVMAPPGPSTSLRKVHGHKLPKSTGILYQFDAVSTDETHECKWSALLFICIPAGVRLCAGDRSDGADWQSADAGSEEAAC